MTSTKIDDGDRLDLAICESKRLLERSRTLLDAASGKRVLYAETDLESDDDAQEKESPPRWAGFF